jgi:hypothetical protein
LASSIDASGFKYKFYLRGISNTSPKFTTLKSTKLFNFPAVLQRAENLSLAIEEYVFRMF